IGIGGHERRAIAHWDRASPSRAKRPVLRSTGAAAPSLAGVPGDDLLATYQVDHDHAVGSGRGELRITTTGFEYRGASKDEARHSRIWRDDEIKRIDIGPERITLTVYEAGAIPILPR